MPSTGNANGWKWICIGYRCQQFFNGLCSATVAERIIESDWLCNQGFFSEMEVRCCTTQREFAAVIFGLKGHPKSLCEAPLECKHTNYISDQQ